MMYNECILHFMHVKDPSSSKAELILIFFFYTLGITKLLQCYLPTYVIVKIYLHSVSPLTHSLFFCQMHCSLLKGNITKENDKFLSFFIKKHFIIPNVFAFFSAEKLVSYIERIVVNFLYTKLQIFPSLVIFKLSFKLGTLIFEVYQV